MSSPGDRRTLAVDRHLVLDSLGGWRGMLDVSLPTVAFVVANSYGGLTVGIWAALGAAVLVFALRLLRRESIQQAVSGLIGVAIAVALARASGEARDFFVVGLVRNAGLGVVLLGSALVRWPLVGVAAEFLAPSHLGSMAEHSLRGSLGGRLRTRGAEVLRVAEQAEAAEGTEPGAGTDGATGKVADPPAERHWRSDRRMMRAYGWLTVMWAGTFLVRFAVQAVLYWQDAVGLLGTSSLVLGLPVTGVALVVTLWVVARLHRHRAVTAR